MANDSNLILSLQQLLTHEAGKKAFLDFHTEKMQLSDLDLKALADNPDFTEVQKQAAILFAKTMHRNKVDIDLNLQILLSNFQQNEDKEARLSSWETIADVVLKAYYVPIYNIVAFNSVNDVVEPLTTFVAAYAEEFNGNLPHNKIFAVKIAKLLLCVTSFKDSAHKSKHFNDWAYKAEQFMLSNGLENSEEYAILLNMRSDEILRSFDSCNSKGSLNKFPAECIDYLQRALDLHKKIGSSLDFTPHMRHVQLCLAVAEAQRLQYQFQSNSNTPFSATLEREVKQKTTEILRLLDVLYPTLQLDGYNLSQCSQVEAQMYLLQGEFSKAVEIATSAINFMPEKHNIQRSKLLNNAGNICVAMAYVLYKSIGNSESKFMLKQMSAHPYTQLAQKILEVFKLKSLATKDLLSIADNFVIMATACYVKSCQILKGIDSLEHPYADEARVALKQLGIEDDLVSLVYFDHTFEDLLGSIMAPDKVPVVEPNIDAAATVTNMFTLRLQEGLNSFKQLLMSLVYSPFTTTIIATQQKPK